MSDFITCAYSLTAAGPLSASSLALNMAAIPVDLSLPNKLGLLYVADSTSTGGATVTRTIQLRITPTSVATATATVKEGKVSGLTLGAHGADYAGPPIVTLSGGAPIHAAKATAQMGVSDAIIINGGAGYAASGNLVVSGGDLSPGGTPATATYTSTLGVISGVTITAPGGPYNTPPTLTATGGTGLILSASLRVNALVLEGAGQGYGSAPSVSFTPLGVAANAGTADPTQLAKNYVSMLSNWMTNILADELRCVIVAATPVLS